MQVAVVSSCDDDANEDELIEDILTRREFLD